MDEIEYELVIDYLVLLETEERLYKDNSKKPFDSFQFGSTS